MTRKSGKHFVGYTNTGQLFRPYQDSSASYTVISTTGDRTSDHRAENLPLSHGSTSYTIHPKLTSKCATT